MTHILLPKSGIHFDTDNLPSLRFFRNKADEISVLVEKLDQNEQLLEGKDADLLWETLYPEKPKTDAPLLQETLFPAKLKTDAPRQSFNWMSALVGNNKQQARREQ